MEVVSDLFCFLKEKCGENFLLNCDLNLPSAVWEKYASQFDHEEYLIGHASILKLKQVMDNQTTASSCLYLNFSNRDVLFLTSVRDEDDYSISGFSDHFHLLVEVAFSNCKQS